MVGVFTAPSVAAIYVVPAAFFYCIGGALSLCVSDHTHIRPGLTEFACHCAAVDHHLFPRRPLQFVAFVHVLSTDRTYVDAVRRR